MANLEYGLRNLITRYTGLFDLEDLQKIMSQWLKARRFWFHEHSYKHHPGDEHGREQEIYWHCERNVDSYVQYQVDIFFHTWDMQKVEIVENGKKKLVDKGRIEIWFKGKVIYDYQGHWDKSKFHRMLRSIYHKYILIPEGVMSSIYWDECYYRILKLRDLVKDHLNMKTKGYEYRRYIRDNI